MDKSTALQIVKIDAVIERLCRNENVSEKNIDELKELKIIIYDNSNRLRRHNCR